MLISSAAPVANNEIHCSLFGYFDNFQFNLDLNCFRDCALFPIYSPDCSPVGLPVLALGPAVARVSVVAPHQRRDAARLKQRELLELINFYIDTLGKLLLQLSSIVTRHLLSLQLKFG